VTRVTGKTVEELLPANASAEQRARLADLAERLFGHVMRVVDLQALYQLDQCLWSELDMLRVEDDEGELAKAMVAEALHRVGRSPDRHACDVPQGISPDEVIAAGYQESCLMCRQEVADMEYRHSGRCCQDQQKQASDKEWRKLLDDAAKQWRDRNAAALRKFGLLGGAEEVVS
jgi:hypothetical protein